MTTTTPVRPELETLPPRLQRLPVDRRGYPVPWFVAWINGEPEFRAMDPEKWLTAVRERRCWVCGDPLGVWLTFAIGPMCGINRTTSEPACHLECATWSARNCPFLSRPQMVRREDGITELMRDEVAGTMIDRNPGVIALWTTRTFRVFTDDKGRPLITMGAPAHVRWYAQGRDATRAEVEHSIATGLPLLEQMARTERGGLDALRDLHARLVPYLPVS